jgi:T-complex protein 1 subunit theta
VIDAEKSEIFDLYLTKFWALKYAVDVACTVLKIDQIIMAKLAGGPKLPADKINSDDE